MALDNLNAPQPAPIKTEKSVDAWPLVVRDMKARNEAGTQKYGTPLQTHNGRRALIDAYQETLDQAVYLRQQIREESDLLEEVNKALEENFETLTEAVTALLRMRTTTLIRLDSAETRIGILGRAALDAASQIEVARTRALPEYDAVHGRADARALAELIVTTEAVVSSLREAAAS